MFGAATRAELELQRNTDREITPALFTNTPLQNPFLSPLSTLPMYLCCTKAYRIKAIVFEVNIVSCKQCTHNCF